MKIKLILMFFTLSVIFTISAYSGPVEVSAEKNIIVEYSPSLFADIPFTQIFYLNKNASFSVRSNVLKEPIGKEKAKYSFGIMNNFYLSAFIRLNSEKNKFVYLC